MSALPGNFGTSATPQLLARRGTFVILMVVGFALFALPVFLGIINHDVAWCLYVAGRVLDGDRLYLDIYEINPPLITCLNFFPQFLARASGISEVASLRLLMLGLVASSLLMTHRVLLGVMPDRPSTRRALLLLSLFILLPLVEYDFAQREHIMLTLFLPYLMMASGRAKGVRLDGGLPWVVGLMAAVGLALKPHFVLPWVAVEVYLAWVRRGWRIWFRPESMTVVAAGLIYGIAVVVVIPEYLKVFEWASSVYTATNRLNFSTLWHEPAIVVSMFAWLGFVVMRPKGDDRGCLEVILVANLSLLAIAIIQNKGYSYHLFPPLAMAVLLVGLLAVEEYGPLVQLERLAVLTMRGVLIIVVLRVAASQVGESLVWRGSPGKSDTSIGRMIRVVQENVKGGSLFTFSPSAAVSFPLVTYGGSGWASGHSCLWFLPALYTKEIDARETIAFHPPASMSKIERFFLDTLISDLVRHKPTLLFVDETENKRAFKEQRFDYLDYYCRDPRFAEFLRDYEPFTKVDEFRVYRRKTGPTPSTATGVEQESGHSH